VETEVLVVGAGPVGVTLGLFLADLGVSAILVDKRTMVSESPRARGVNARGAEILRMVGVENDMVSHALPVRPELQVRQDLGQDPRVVQPTGGEKSRR
jgi:2-polyprenyl-6-methoxyphenol hydroxylase-like FAD-dependent oxidoreductase